MSRLRVRLVSLCAVILLFSWWAVASFVPKETRLASPLLPDEGLRLGLDLQGGIHWVLGPDLAVAETHELEFQAKAIQQLAEEKSFGIEAARVEDGRVRVTGIGADGQRAVQQFASDHGGLRVLAESGSEIEIGLTNAWRDEVRSRGMLQVLEVLRRRIEDPVTGIPESVVTRQGDDRILVQIPGGKIERERAGDLLETTGFLEFKIVKDTAPTQELLEDKHPNGLPPDTEIVFERDKETNRVLNAFLVPVTPDLTGDYLTDARVAFDRQGRPIVSFTFNAEGGRVFGELTARSIGQPLAIILDDLVYSAPVVRSQISMRGQIEGDTRFTVREDGADLVLQLTPEWATEVRERAMLQALEVLRRRIDDPQTGIPESVITRQGRDRILIEIPGVDRVPDIFRKTGFLEFKIVKDAAPSEELLRAKHKDGLPPGTEIAVEKERKTDRVITAYLVPVDADINGDFLTDAQVQFDNRVNEWQVTFTWSAEGGQIFGELTEKSIGQPLAIILDDHVYSAPVIRDRISRQGQISGRFSSEEARDLAVVLRAGALPIPVKIEEERTIGPALGQDSIRRGIWASVVSFVLVVALTIVYYRLSGAYASLALIVNMISLVGLMALFEGTLTMPGIAGLVLTVGMAVDANVIIFERIREELRAGRTPRAAIAAGFQKAGRTILDANVTNMITAVVLFEYGTGPIKGFAVTLSVGILTSVFAALVVTRILYELYPGNRSVTDLSV